MLVSSASGGTSFPAPPPVTTTAAQRESARDAAEEQRLAETEAAKRAQSHFARRLFFKRLHAAGAMGPQRSPSQFSLSRLAAGTFGTSRKDASPTAADSSVRRRLSGAFGRGESSESMASEGGTSTFWQRSSRRATDLRESLQTAMSSSMAAKAIFGSGVARRRREEEAERQRRASGTKFVVMMRMASMKRRSEQQRAEAERRRRERTALVVAREQFERPKQHASQSGRLVEAAAGHHGLLGMHPKAWGDPPCS